MAPLAISFSAPLAILDSNEHEVFTLGGLGGGGRGGLLVTMHGQLVELDEDLGMRARQPQEAIPLQKQRDGRVVGDIASSGASGPAPE